MMNTGQQLFDLYFKPSLELETSRVLLRSMNEDDSDAFSPLTADKEIWTYFSKDLSEPGELEQWMEAAMAQYHSKQRMPFTIFDKETNTVAGSTSFGNISFYDKRIEIGWSWLGTKYMGTGINQHAKFLLLSYAFEVIKMERVEIKTDNLNERAKAALYKIGAFEEGVLRSHMQMPNNRRRDSVYFSILKSEWEAVKEIRFSRIF